MIKAGEEVGFKKLKDTLNRFGFDTENLQSETGESNDLRLAKLTLGETLPVSMVSMVSMVKLMIALLSIAPTSLGENHNICNWSIEHMVINPATLND